MLGFTMVVAACGDDEGDDGGAADGDTTTTAEDGSGEEPGGTLVIYSGRNEELVGPLIADFEEATGISVEIRYGDPAEIAAQTLEERDTSPAHVFFDQPTRPLSPLAPQVRLVPHPHTHTH